MIIIRLIFVLSVAILSVMINFHNVTENKILHHYFRIIFFDDITYKLAFKESTKPFGGESLLHKDVQFARNWLRSSQVDSYKLSESMKESTSVKDIRTRFFIIEGAYPIQASDSSHYLFTYMDDKLPQDSHVLDYTEGLKVAYTP